jgi:hypothetical protein
MTIGKIIVLAVIIAMGCAAAVFVWPHRVAAQEPHCRTLEEALAIAYQTVQEHGVYAAWYREPLPDGGELLVISIVGGVAPLVFHFGADGCLIRPEAERPPVNGTPA